jgi:hypothetical protein
MNNTNAKILGVVTIVLGYFVTLAYIVKKTTR